MSTSVTEYTRVSSSASADCTIYIFARSYIGNIGMIRKGIDTQTPSQRKHSMQNRMGGGVKQKGNNVDA